MAETPQKDGLEAKVNSGTGSKLNRAAKVAWRTATFNLGANEDAVYAAKEYLKKKEGVITGNDVWEVEHNLHMSKRSRKKLEERLTSEGKISSTENIKSDLQYRNGEGFWGHIQSGVNYAMDKTRFSKLFGHLEVYKNEKTGRGLDLTRNCYVSPEGSAVITGLLVVGPAAFTTGASVAASLASYSKFSGGMSVINAFSDGLQNSHNDIAQNIGAYSGIAAMGAMAALTGNYFTAARTGTAVAQLGISKKGHKGAAALAGALGYGLSMGSLVAYNGIMNSHDNNHAADHPGAAAHKEIAVHKETVQSSAHQNPVSEQSSAYSNACDITTDFADPRCNSGSMVHLDKFFTEPVNMTAQGAQHSHTISFDGYYDLLDTNIGTQPAHSYLAGLFGGLMGACNSFEDKVQNFFSCDSDLAKIYSRYVPNHDIVWHNNGTSHSDHNELSLQVNHDGVFSLSRYFDLDRINSGHDLPRGAHQISDKIDVDDLVLRIGVDANGNGRFDGDDLWLSGRFDSHGVVREIHDIYGNHLVHPETLVSGNHLNPGVMAQVDYHDADTGLMHSIATALSGNGHGNGHHGHGGGHGHGRHYVNNYHNYYSESSNTINNNVDIDINVDSHDLIINMYGQGGNCPEVKQCPTGDHTVPATGNPEDVDVRHSIDSPYILRGSYDFNPNGSFIANPDGVHYSGVIDSGRTSVGIEVPGGYNHETSFYDQRGHPVEVRETVGNRWRQLIFGDDNHAKYKEVKQGGVLDRINEGDRRMIIPDYRTHEVTNRGESEVGNPNIPNHPLTNQQRLTMREQEYNAMSPDGNMTNHSNPRHADVFSKDQDPNIRASVTDVYNSHGDYVSSDVTAWEVRSDANRVRGEQMAVDAVAGAAVYSALPHAANGSNNVYNGISGGQNGGPGITNPGSGVGGGQQIGGPGIQ